MENQSRVITLDARHGSHDHSDANITRNHYLDDRVTGKTEGVDFLPRLDLEDATFIEDAP